MSNGRRWKSFLIIISAIAFVVVRWSLDEHRDSVQVADILIEGEEALKIALTFDDGPCQLEGTTEALLDGLKERGVRVSFFLLGKQVEQAPELVQRMYDEGHLIGNHSYSHVNLAQLSEQEALREITSTNSIIEKVIGEDIGFIRPPFGAWNTRLEDRVSLMTVMWSVDPLDWNTTNIDGIVNKVVTEIKENDIILLHDSFPTSVEAALRIIDCLKGKGYEFVTVDELLIN